MLKNFFEHSLVKIFFTVIFTFFLFFLCLFFFIAMLTKGFDNGTMSISKGSIGIVDVTGLIKDSDSVLKRLKEFSENDNIAAIVLRINSPGGAVVPSQEIYREIEKIRKKKKVYAYLQSVAASGGYYIASACNKIIANPGTITGSIGVIIEFTNFQKLLEKIGIKPVIIKVGKFKDTGNPFRPMSEDEKVWLNKVAQNIYAQFVRDVSKGRNIPIRDLKKIADGRILSGEQAIKYNLVDKLGNFSDLINMVKKDIGLKEKPELIYPVKRRSIINKILEDSEKTFLKLLEVTY